MIVISVVLYAIVNNNHYRNAAAPALFCNGRSFNPHSNSGIFYLAGYWLFIFISIIQ